MQARKRGKEIALLAALCVLSPAQALELDGTAIQGGLIFGQTDAGGRVFLDDREIMVSADGRFVIGFGRDETGVRALRVTESPDSEVKLTLEVAPREYKIERVDGLPPKTVTPDPEAAQRIKEEGAMVVSARALRDERSDYSDGFSWPAQGRISGVYGSQRVLNGEPRRPHFGLDIAADTGNPVYAPADGIITLAHPDLYFSGGTVILDHGYQLSSTFLHMSEVSVAVGAELQTGDLIGAIGATGRATGPHLDWRMNWRKERIDPQLLAPPMPEAVHKP